MFFAILAGVVSAAFWGILYIFPLLLPEYSSFQTGIGRCCVTGLFSILLVFYFRDEIRKLKRSDWMVALRLALIGCLINFMAQLYCSDFSGASIAGLSTGIIPVILTLYSNERDRKLGRWSVPLKPLIAPTLLIFFGFVLCNYSEFVTNPMSSSPLKFMIGVALGLLHSIIWTWYPIANADWIKANPQVNVLAWTSLIFALLFPFSIVLYLFGLSGILSGFEYSLLGPTPWRFIAVMLVGGIVSSWGAMTLWNYMCKRVPTSLAGQMMVLETLFAMLFGHVLQKRFPTWDLIAGTVLLVIGVSTILHLFQKYSARKKAL